MDIQVIRKDIYEVIKDAVKDGLIKIQEIEASGKYVPTYYEFPRMKKFESGFPNFTKYYSSDGPKDYRIISQEYFNPGGIESWKAFRKLALSDKKLSGYLKIYDSDTNIQDPQHQVYIGIFADYAIKKLIDRYIHLTNKREFEESSFFPIYQLWENGAFWEKLDFDIYIPILYQTFSFDNFEILPGIIIEKMSDDFQKARNTKSSFNISVSNTVIGSATHALVLKYWNVTNDSEIKRNMILENVAAYSLALEKIHIFFAALRIETGVETGFSQIIASPTGWADSWEAYLPPVYVVTVRAYPDSFENYGWLNKPTVIEENSCKAIGPILNVLLNATDNRFILAVKRLNAAFLRKNEEDSILDVTIGLEALLLGDNRNEITHKLAMRVAGLSKIEAFEQYSPQDIYDICKKVYDYRSDVIHGSPKVDAKRTIKLKEEKIIPTLQLGISLLRYVIRALCNHPEFQDPKEIDRYLLRS